ncbi:MAG: hydantoinase/oxoprolinase family protein [Anaerolineales bacterium]|nr:hydantoinase/oxoprolinase family protein [Anaerolineales bacterium]
MAVLLGIDTGGTYTDAVLLDEKQGVLGKAKALTTRHDLSIGIQNAIEKVLPFCSSPIQLVSLSTTLATNAIVEGQGSPVCLILIGYDADTLNEIKIDKLIPPQAIVYLSGGHTVNGEEQAPLDLAEAERAILNQAPHVSAFAISGYFSVRNPRHELQVRALTRRLTHKPVTCGHELTSHLHAPRRALTTVLNARLIPLLARLIQSVQKVLDQNNIQAPLMVVKGDGSLMEANMALERPVETICSGPAASSIGAQYLCRQENVIVIDMGGTTTDIAVLQGAQPVLNTDGAFVGNWQTMVEAIDMHTTGLGGDSEIRLNENNQIVVGPQRVIPLSLLGVQFPQVIELMRVKLKRKSAFERSVQPGVSCRFYLRQSRPEINPEAFSASQREIWNQLDNQPTHYVQLMAGLKYPTIYQRDLGDMIGQGIIAVSGFTPTDALHVLERYSNGSEEAARLGAQSWAKHLSVEADEFCRQVIRQVEYQAGKAVLSAAFAGEGYPAPDSRGDLGELLVDQALGARTSSAFRVDVSLQRPLAAIGAPVCAYIPEVAHQLKTRLYLPEHAEVGNAIGAVVGSILQTVHIAIRAINGGVCFRAFLPDGIRDFPDLEEAVTFAQEIARTTCTERAHLAGAQAAQIKLNRRDHFAKAGSGSLEKVFVETVITASAVGRPRLGSSD